MCSLGQDKTTSIGGAAPASTMLGPSSVGSSTGTAATGRGARRVLGGTFLGGKTAPPPRDTPRDTLPRNPGSPSPYNQPEY